MLVGSLLLDNGGDIAPPPPPPNDPPPNPIRLPGPAGIGKVRSSGNAKAGPTRLGGTALDDKAGGECSGDPCCCFDCPPPAPLLMLPDLPTMTDETLTTSDALDLPPADPFPKKSTAATLVVPSSRDEGGT